MFVSFKKELKVILYKRRRCNNKKKNDSHVDPVCAELFEITKICIGSLTTKIFKIVKLYGSPCMYDKQKIEKSEEKKETDNWEKEWYCVPTKDIHNRKKNISVRRKEDSLILQ